MIDAFIITALGLVAIWRILCRGGRPVRFFRGSAR